uniref:Uncharacterized protein n=1 Tax=Cacopsylla melanoneura TaxID=428564 RepID=A0A8D9C249_9HEMI
MPIKTPMNNQCPMPIKIPMNNQCPIPIKIGNFEQMVNPDDKFKVKMFFYTGEPRGRRPPTAPAKCKRCKPKQANYSGSCMQSTKETCDLDAFLAGQAAKTDENDGGEKKKKKKDKKEKKDKKGKKGKENPKEEDKPEEKKDENKKEEKKDEEKKDEKEREEAKSLYKIFKPANLDKDIVFKSIKEIAPKYLGEHIVIKTKTPVRRTIHDMAPRDWSPQFIHPKTPNRLPKAAPFNDQHQNNVKVSPNPVQPIQESYSINHVHTIHLTDLASAPNKKHFYSRPKISSIIKNFENKLIRRFGKRSLASTRKDQSSLEDNIRKRNTLQKITEKSKSKGKPKKKVSEDRTESRELASILMTPDVEKRREIFTQTSVLHTVPETIPDKIVIAKQNSIQIKEQIESNNGVAIIRSIYCKFNKHDGQTVNSHNPRNEMKHLTIDSDRYGVTEKVSKQPIEIKEIVDGSSEDENEWAKKEKPFIKGPTQSIGSLDKVIRHVKEFKRIYKKFEGNKNERNSTSLSRVETLTSKKFELNNNDANEITQSVSPDEIKGSMEIGQTVESIGGSAPSSILRYNKRPGNESLTRKLDEHDNSRVSAICKLKRNFGAHANDLQIPIKNTIKGEPLVNQIVHKEKEKPKQANNMPYISETMDLCTFMPKTILPRNHGISNSIWEEKESNIKKKKINKREMDLCKYLPRTIIPRCRGILNSECEEKKTYTGKNKINTEEMSTANKTTSAVGVSERNDTYPIEKSSKDKVKEKEEMSLSVYRSKHIHTNKEERKLKEKSSSEDVKHIYRKQIVIFTHNSKHIHTNEKEITPRGKISSDEDSENEGDKEGDINEGDNTILKHIHTNGSHTNLDQNENETKNKQSSKHSMDNVQTDNTEHPKMIRQKDQTSRPQAKARKSEVEQTVTLFKDLANMIIESCLGSKEIDLKSIDYIEHILTFFDLANTSSTSRQYNLSKSQIIITDLEDDFHENSRNEALTSGNVQPMEVRQNEQPALERTVDENIPFITSDATSSMENNQRMDVFKTTEESTSGNCKQSTSHHTKFEKN